MNRIFQIAALAAALGATASGAQAATNYNSSKSNITQTVGQGDADFIAKCTALKGVVSGKSPHLICTYPAPPAATAKKIPGSGRIC